MDTSDTALTLDQLLAIDELGSGPYGGGDVARWSPDGRELLVAARLGGELGLWLVPAAGGFPRRVTTAPITLQFLASPLQSFSPDGRWVAFLSEINGATELWLWASESGRQYQLTHLGNHIAGYSWARDGQSLLVASNAQGCYDIYRVSMPDGRATRLTGDACYEVSPVETPDSARVLFVRLDERWAAHEVVSMAASGGDEHVIATDDDLFDYHYGRTFGVPAVAPDGSVLLFRSHRSGWIKAMLAHQLAVADQHRPPVDRRAHRQRVRVAEHHRFTPRWTASRPAASYRAGRAARARQRRSVARR